MEQNGTQSAYIGAESPGRLAEFRSLLVPRHAGLLNRTSAPTAGLRLARRSAIARWFAVTRWLHRLKGPRAVLSAQSPMQRAVYRGLAAGKGLLKVSYQISYVLDAY